jgi:putative hemolysin
MSIEYLLLEAFLIAVLILVNGLFSGSEIAIISAKRSIIENLSREGNRKATLVSTMKADPEKFLATVQVGVTVVGTLASVMGGVLASDYLEPYFESAPIGLVSEHSELISVAIAVVVISYLMLVFGELVPKSLALRYAERIACATAHPLGLLSRSTGFFVHMLANSTNYVLKFLRVKDLGKERMFISEEEIKYFIKEGRETGVLEDTEASLLHGIFEFADTSVHEIMVARPNFTSIDVNSTPEALLKAIVESGFSRYPVCEGTPGEVVGVLYSRDLLKAMEEKTAISVRDLMRKPYFVPDSIMISKLLREMQRRKVHIAMVVDEHGNVVGLVTIEDILEEIVGEIEDEYDVGQNALVSKLDDGSVLIDASATLRDLADMGYPFEESEDYSTLAGLMLTKLQRLPRGGEFVIHNGYRLTIVDVDKKRIARVRAELVDKKPLKAVPKSA